MLKDKRYLLLTLQLSFLHATAGATEGNRDNKRALRAMDEPLRMARSTDKEAAF